MLHKRGHKFKILNYINKFIVKKIRGILIFKANPLIHMDIQNIINKGKVSSKTENISFPLWKIYPKEGWIIFVWQWETWEHGWVNGLTIKKQNMDHNQIYIQVL